MVLDPAVVSYATIQTCTHIHKRQRHARLNVAADVYLCLNFQDDAGRAGPKRLAGEWGSYVEHPEVAALTAKEIAKFRDDAGAFHLT